jgi:hypothetical protein
MNQQGEAKRLVISEDSVKDLETSEDEVAHEELHRQEAPSPGRPAQSSGRHDH